MDLISIFCKSYRGDLDRAIELSKSIMTHNTDNIPFYISVPTEDIELFKENIPFFTRIINDKEIFHFNQGWIGQQFIKSGFYKLKLSRYYLAIDSDSYFIKDFCIKDFLHNEDTPYMVMDENNTMFEWTDRYSRECFPFDPRESYTEDYKIIKGFFGREGKTYHYGPTPCVWDTQIWERLDKDYTIEKLFKLRPNELNWYGEAVLFYKSKFMPCSPLFKCFHYSQQYSFYKQLGWTEEDFSKQYFGFVIQSNWDGVKAPLKY